MSVSTIKQIAALLATLEPFETAHIEPDGYQIVADHLVEHRITDLPPLLARYAMRPDIADLTFVARRDASYRIHLSVSTPLRRWSALQSKETQ